MPFLYLCGVIKKLKMHLQVHIIKHWNEISLLKMLCFSVFLLLVTDALNCFSCFPALVAYLCWEKCLCPKFNFFLSDSISRFMKNKCLERTPHRRPKPHRVSKIVANNLAGFFFFWPSTPIISYEGRVLSEFNVFSWNL